MASITKKFHSDGYAVRIDCTTNSQNVSNNTSNVTVSVHLVSMKSSYNISASAVKNGSVTINGTKYAFTFNATLSSLQDKTLYTKTVDIAHNSDGNKTLSLSASLGVEVTLSGTWYGTVTASGSVTLTSIPRTTPISVSSQGTFGNAITINHSRASSSFTVTVRYTCGTTSGWLVQKVSTNSTTWTIPKSLQSEIPKATSINITLYCDTYNGTTLIGTTSTSFTCSIASDCVPSISSGAFTNADTGGTSYWQTVSKVRAEINCAGVYGSTITKYVMTVDGQTITNYGNIIWSGVLTGSGNKDISLTITDSRGKTATKTWTNAISITSYAKPTITLFTCKRTEHDENGVEVISNLGNIGYFTVSASFHANATSQTRKFMYKPTGTSTWTTITLNNENQNDYCFSSALATGSAYDLRYVMTDNISTTEMSIVMQNIFPLVSMSADGTGIAFGKECNISNLFEVNIPGLFSSSITTKSHVQVETSNGTGKYYGNQVWLNDCLSISSTGNGNTLYFNSAASHAYLDFYGATLFRGRGSNMSTVRVDTNDGNGSGDGITHLGYYQSAYAGYGHYFRGKGKLYVDNAAGLEVTADSATKGSMVTDKITCYSSSGYEGSWGVGCLTHFYPTSTDRYLGVSSFRWQQLYCVSSPNVSSDAKTKENVKYMYEKPEVICEHTDVRENDEITTQDLLDFVKNDLYMVTFDYKMNTEGMDENEAAQVTAMHNRQIGFIAQDLAETKVGKYLVTKDADGILGYESANWPSIIAGALQQEIRTREAADKKLMEMLEDMINE